jgi:hypothetical protein
MSSQKLELILVQVGLPPKPDKNMGVVQGEWKEIEKLANHFCQREDYTTWKIKDTKKRKIDYTV